MNQNEGLAEILKKYGRHPQFLGDEILDVNQPGGFDDSLLHLAARKGELEDVKVLLARGADPAIKNEFGKTAADWAKAENNNDVLSLLRCIGQRGPGTIEHLLCALHSLPKTMNDDILGFQLRVPPDRLTNWDQKRRSEFLLREEIAHPLSVDEGVWPLFDDLAGRQAVFVDPDLPSNGLNVHELKPGARAVNGCLVAITVSEAVAPHLRSQHRIKSSAGGNAMYLDKVGMHLLGFDVADVWLYSALSNCGFKDSKQAMAKRFSHCLNDDGLFQARGDAEEFRAIADKRIPDHTPFHIYGLWSARECGSIAMEVVHP